MPTTKYGIPYVDENHALNTGPDEINAGLDAVDSKMVGYSQGTLAARPVSTGGTPGIAGRRYRATDTGQEFIDTGTSWVEIAQAPLTYTFADYATAGSTYSTIGTTSWQVPVTGLYEVEMGARIFVTGAGGGSIGFRQGANAVNLAQILALQGAPSLFGVWISRKGEATLTGGQAIDLRAAASGSASADFNSPRIAIRRLS